MGEFKTSGADPTQADEMPGGTIDLYQTALSTGAATLTFDEPFDEEPLVVVSSATGDAGWSAKSASSVDLTGTGSEVVQVIAIGPRNQS